MSSSGTGSAPDLYWLFFPIPSAVVFVVDALLIDILIAVTAAAPSGRARSLTRVPVVVVNVVVVVDNNNNNNSG